MVPQLLFIGLSAWAVIRVASKDTTKEATHFKYALFSQVIVHGLLYWGGFYDGLMR